MVGRILILAVGMHDQAEYGDKTGFLCGFGDQIEELESE